VVDGTALAARSLGKCRQGGEAMKGQDFAGNVEPDVTVQAFSTWLTELKFKSGKTLQEMLSEMSLIRDGITSNNVELTDFKRHSTGISQQMQSQLTDLREKLTNAFGEITSLVKQKTQSDQEMMKDINSLQQNVSSKTAELEALKKSYSQAHHQLQSSLIQIQNHLQVTNSEVQTAKASCDRVYRDTTQRFAEMDDGLRSLEDKLSVGNAENRNQMIKLQEEIARIHEHLASVNADFLDHKRATNSVHNRLQSQVWSLEEGRKRQQGGGGGSPPYSQMVGSYQPEPAGAAAEAAAHAAAGLTAPSTTAAGPYTVMQPAGMQAPAAPRYGHGSVVLPCGQGQAGMHPPPSTTVMGAQMPTRGSVVLPAAPPTTAMVPQGMPYRPAGL